MKVHEFATSGEAYDASQYRDDIKDGDVLHVPSEGSAAVLLSAWPISVTPGYVPDISGAFGGPMPGYDIHDVIADGQEYHTYREPGFYAGSIEAALKLVNPDEVLKPHPQHSIW
jgi:hypothetical protein